MLLALPAHAAPPDGEAALRRVDEAMQAFSDATFESRLLVHRGARTQEYRFTTWLKRPGKRLVQFTAPAEVKGMGVLVLDGDSMYVFLPGYQKVRRMGSHVRSQSFMGSDLSFEEVARTALAPRYRAREAVEEGARLRLELEARPGQETEFPRLTLWVDARTFRPLRLECRDGAGGAAKTEERSEGAADAALEAGRITVVDHRHGDRRSELEYRMTARDRGLTDDLFTVRSLARGP
jgi:outer membrane lipoprotein-sorting protein